MNGEESPPSKRKLPALSCGPDASENRSDLSCQIARAHARCAETHARTIQALGNGFVRVLLWISPFPDSRLSQHNRILNRNQTPARGKPLTRMARRLRLLSDFVLVEIPRRPGAERQSREDNDQQQQRHQRRALASIIRVHQ